MGHPDRLRCREVSDGAGDLEDAVVGACGELHRRDGRAQECPRLGLHGAVALQLARAHVGIAERARQGSSQGDFFLRELMAIQDGEPLSEKPLALQGTCPLHPASNRSRCLAGRRCRELVVVETWNLEVNVDPIQERT